jgi:outer membrane protein
MKNGLIVWNVILSLVAGFLLFMQLTPQKNNTSSAVKNIAKETTTENKQFRLAYFEMDSVAANFDMAKEFKTEVMSREEAINSEMDKMAKNLQQRVNYYQNQAQSGTMTESQRDEANLEIKKLDEEMKNRKQLFDQEYNDFVLRRQNDIKAKIKGFIKDYNKAKEYSYIVSDDPGLFYYQDTVYNITADVVRGLNDFYKKKNK